MAFVSGYQAVIRAVQIRYRFISDSQVNTEISVRIERVDFATMIECIACHPNKCWVWIACDMRSGNIVHAVAVR